MHNLAGFWMVGRYKLAATVLKTALCKKQGESVTLTIRHFMKIRQKKIEIQGLLDCVVFNYKYIDENRRDVLEKALERATGDSDVEDWVVQCAIVETEEVEGKPLRYTELNRKEMLLSEIKALFREPTY